MYYECTQYLLYSYGTKVEEVVFKECFWDNNRADPVLYSEYHYVFLLQKTMLM